jgi:murein DD-endopeptidase MepM/ murein hydrolase activator NlpD
MQYHIKYRYNKKKNRKRGFPLIRIVISLTVIAFFWKSFRNNNSTSEETIQSAAIVPSFQEIGREKASVVSDDLSTYIVKSGDTFYGIMSRHEIPQATAVEIYNSLKPLGLPALFPGDSLVLKKDSSGTINKINLLSRLQYWYNVSLIGNQIKAEKKPLSTTRYICLLNGALETSLSEEVYKYGVSDVVTWRIADIFAWDINFFLDPRKGDTFQIIFEQKYAEGNFLGYGEILAAKYTNNGTVYYAFGFPDEDGKIRYYDLNGKSVQKQFLKAPLRYSRISSGFSYNRKHPILGIVRPHLGIDYAAPTGTPVYAAADGRVKFAGRKGGYGNLVILSHGSAYETWYGHLNAFGRGIRTGKVVKQSDKIGTVGATGLATGPHLDYRMKRGSGFVNPLKISMPSKESIETEKKSSFDLVKNSYLLSFDSRLPEQTGNFVLDIQIRHENPVTYHAENSESNKSNNGINTES